MTVKVTGTPFNQIVPEIKEALDTALAGTLNLQQSSLAKANPKDTGRMAASWTVGHNTPDRSVKPEGQQDPTPTPYSGKITFDGTWYITNSLPYAERAGEGAGGQGPYNGRRGTTNWYKNITAHSQEDWQRALRRFLRKPPPRNFRPT